MLRYKTETRPDLVALYDIRPGNVAGQFLQTRSPHMAVTPERMQTKHAGNWLCKWMQTSHSVLDVEDASRYATARRFPRHLCPRLVHINQRKRWRIRSCCKHISNVLLQYHCWHCNERQFNTLNNWMNLYRFCYVSTFTLWRNFIDCSLSQRNTVGYSTWVR